MTSMIRYDEVKDLGVPLDHRRGLVMVGLTFGLLIVSALAAGASK